MRPSVRDAAPSEAGMVHGLLVEAFAHANLAFTIYRTPKSVGRLATLATEGRIRVVGQTEGVAIRTGDHLDYLAVDRAARGQGFGRALMDDFHRTGGVSLDVLEDHRATFDWYRSLGYEVRDRSLSARLAVPGLGTPPETWAQALADEKANGFAAVGHSGMRLGLLGEAALRLLDLGGRPVDESLRILSILQFAGRNEVVLTGLDRLPGGYEALQSLTSVRMRRA